MKECIYVTLNFENFKHQEISPQEGKFILFFKKKTNKISKSKSFFLDLLLTMFNTAVSNLILFKVNNLLISFFIYIFYYINFRNRINQEICCQWLKNFKMVQDYLRQIQKSFRYFHFTIFV